MRVRSELHRRGLRYRVDVRPIPSLRRRADVVFTKARVAVFIDGCFWHGCERHSALPKTNVEFWRNKIARNRTRDEETDMLLTDAGWTVFRFCEKDDPTDVASAVQRAVLRPRGGGEGVAVRHRGAAGSGGR
jgi:DNA mismatch endonuclease (patch repair protein)